MNIQNEKIDSHSRKFIYEFPGDGVKFISKLQSHCANMTLYEKSRYNRLLQEVTHKGGVSSMSYIKISQNTQALLVPEGRSYSGDQRIHIFLDNFHQGGKYSAKIASHQ